MSKAILILDDMPKSCMDCDIFNHEEMTCLGLKVHFGELNKTQSWCPLKPLPEKMDEYKDQRLNNYAWGWNDCIDELVGEKQ